MKILWDQIINDSYSSECIHSFLHKQTNNGLCLQIATVITAEATWGFAQIHRVGWGWTLVVWLYNIVIYMLLDPIKFFVRYVLSGRAWSLVLNKRVSEFDPSISTIESYF